MNPTENHRGAQHVLFDADQLSGVEPYFFDPAALAQAGLLRGSAEGRGTTHFVELNGAPCVLRHYRRGGLVAKLLDDRYRWASLPETRAWREWHLLADLEKQGLPVPRPVAARVITRGLFYRADLIMQRLNGTRSLCQALENGPLSTVQWSAIGHCIRRFHDAGVYHADLNAHNILLDAEGSLLSEEDAVWLIDFDKGEIRPPALDWQQANLARLRRSLDKLAGLRSPFHFAEADWRQLMVGWQG
ncbi:MAG: 3-deoxy-D-manno-octulosonic acid kinase [Gammaproteobacteria bacterium]|nr:3-deoxy-D-manno-octulosonic acid kinase [Gammaproteobacteria bacterium]